MFGKKKQEPAVEPKPAEKPTPAFLRPDYPYQAVGEAITDLDLLEPTAVYEIKCHQCEMSIRSQGRNIKSTYERLKGSGCMPYLNENLSLLFSEMTEKIIIIICNNHFAAVNGFYYFFCV